MWSPVPRPIELRTPRPTHQPANLATSSSLRTAWVRSDYGGVGAIEEVRQEDGEEQQRHGEEVPGQQLQALCEPVAEDLEQRGEGGEGVGPEGDVFEVSRLGGGWLLR